MLVILIILILSIFFFQKKNKEGNLFQEELIFFKLFSWGQEEKSSEIKAKERTLHLSSIL